MLLQDGKSAFVFEFTDTAAGKTHRDAVIEAHRVHGSPASAAAAGGQAASTASTAAVAGKPSPPAAAAPRVTLHPPPDLHPALAGKDVRSLKQQVLSTRRDLRSDYEGLVVAGLVPEGEFWAADARKALLVDAALSRPQIGLSSRAPETIMRIAKGAASGMAEESEDASISKVKVDQQMQLAVFKREPAVAEAFQQYVPKRQSMKDFWIAYLKADSERQQRRQQLQDGLLLSGRAGPQGGYASATGVIRPVSAVKDMTPAEFFDALKKGEFPPTATAAAGGGAAARKRSAIGPVDSSFDLLSTVEESTRAKALRGAPGSAEGSGDRGGYGTREGSRPYEFELPSGVGDAAGGASLSSRRAQERMEAARKKERVAETLIYDLNSYSRQVVDTAHEGVGTASASSSTSAPSSLMPSPTASNTSAASSSSSSLLLQPSHRRSDAPGPASAADDLPDLYTPMPPSSDVVPLQVDLYKLRESLAAQGEQGAAPAAGNGSGPVPSNSSVDTSRFLQQPAQQQAVPLTTIQPSGWSIVNAADSSSSGSSRKTLIIKPSSGLEASSIDRGDMASSQLRKRPHPDPVREAAGSPAAQQQQHLQQRPAKPDPFQALSGKPFLTSSKALLRDLTSSAHDLFEAGDRSSRTGMLRSIPKAWQQWVEGRFRHHRELLAMLWPTLTSARRDARAGDKRKRLLNLVAAEYAGLERIKRDVLSKGAHALLPPPLKVEAGKPASVLSAVPVEVVVMPSSEEEGRAATSGLVALLNMLQAALHPSIQRAEEEQAAAAAAGLGMGAHY